MIVCRSCGFVGTLAELKAAYPSALSCCPEREEFEPDDTWRPVNVWSVRDADYARAEEDAARKRDADAGFGD